MRFRVPEIFLGMLLATSIFALGFIAAQQIPVTPIDPNQAHSEDGTGESESEYSEPFWQRSITDPIAFFTLWIAIFTAVLSGSTIGLYRVTRANAEAALATAQAAKEANEITRKNFVAEQRPWIVADIRVGGPITYNVNGLNVVMDISLRNIGKWPAKNVYIRTNLISAKFRKDGMDFDPLASQRDTIQKTKGRAPVPWGSTVFADQPANYQYSVVLGKERLAEITQEVDFVVLAMVVVVDYRFDLSTEAHQTGYVFNIERSNTPRPESTTKNRNPSGIFPDEGDVPASEVVFKPWPLGGDYAD